MRSCSFLRICLTYIYLLLLKSLILIIIIHQISKNSLLKIYNTNVFSFVGDKNPKQSISTTLLIFLLQRQEPPLQEENIISELLALQKIILSLDDINILDI